MVEWLWLMDNLTKYLINPINLRKYMILLLQMIIFLISYQLIQGYCEKVKNNSKWCFECISKGHPLFSISGNSDRTTIDKAEIASCKAFSKHRIDYCMVILVPSYLPNFTKVGSKLILKCTLYVTEIFLGIMLKFVNLHNHPEKMKLKTWGNWDLDMLISIWSFQYVQNHLC